MSYFPVKTREKTITENRDEFLYKPKAEKLNEIVKYFSGRLVTNEQLLGAKEGLYTWILRDSGNFYAIKTITKQEIGTLHANLKLFTDPYDASPIKAAGELEIIREEKYAPPTIIFNLLSGTYMAKKFDKLSAMNTLLLRNELVGAVEGKFMSFGIPSQFLECSAMSCSEEEKIGGKKLIEAANIRTSPKKLGKLNTMFNRRGGRRTQRRKTRKVRV
jgi:hypothetical protein